METAEQIKLLKSQIEVNREQFLDQMMFAFDVEEITSEQHLSIIEILTAHEATQKKYISALESEQIKFDLFCRS